MVRKIQLKDRSRNSHSDACCDHASAKTKQKSTKTTRKTRDSIQLLVTMRTMTLLVAIKYREETDDGWPESVEEQGLLLLV